MKLIMFISNLFNFYIIFLKLEYPNEEGFMRSLINSALWVSGKPRKKEGGGRGGLPRPLEGSPHILGTSLDGLIALLVCLQCSCE